MFRPYAGSWDCLHRSTAAPSHHDVFHFDFDHGQLRQTIVEPALPKAPTGNVWNATFAYDAVRARYVEVEMDSSADWFVDTADRPEHGVFHWTDVVASVTPARWEMTLPARGAFTISSFDRYGDTAPADAWSCKKTGG